MIPLFIHLSTVLTYRPIGISLYFYTIIRLFLSFLLGFLLTTQLYGLLLAVLIRMTQIA